MRDDQKRRAIQLIHAIKTRGELTEEQNRAIVQIMQGQPVAYEGEHN